MKRLFYKLILWLVMGIVISLPVTFGDWFDEQDKLDEKLEFSELNQN